MKKLVVLSGSGISAESGIKTFRDMGGLWELYDVTKVASPVAWETNRDLVLRFYNERRKNVMEAEPNAAHRTLVDLENFFDVNIITQNVDDLHERAGSKKILHLHGEIRKARSTADPELIYKIDGWELKQGDKCKLGSQLRPHIVWFGEDVQEIPNAIEIVKKADIFVIIGTSLNVYPAAGLVDYVPSGSEIYLIDPVEIKNTSEKINIIRETATRGTRILRTLLLSSFNGG